MKILFLVSFLAGALVVLGQACTSTMPTTVDSGLNSNGLDKSTLNAGRGGYVPPNGSGGSTSSGLQASAVSGTWSTACTAINDPSYGSYRQKQIVQIGTGTSNGDGTSYAAIQVTVINANSTDVNCASGSQSSSSGIIAMNSQGYGSVNGVAVAAANLQLNGSSGQVIYYDLIGYDGSSHIYFGLQTSSQTGQSDSQRPTQVNTNLPFSR
jgi:hypothetical protein